MEQFISIIVFSIPGLLVYFWIMALGMNPAVKHSAGELAAIAALFWIPVVLLSVYSFNLLSGNVGWAWFGLDLPNIYSIDDMTKRAQDIGFIFYFAFSSIVFSFIVAVVWTVIHDNIVLPIINKLRIKRKLSALSDTSTVWDEFFIKLSSKKEESLVVEICKIDKPEEKLMGSVTKMSRPYETERSLVLEKVEELKESHEYFQYETKRAFIDTKSGLVVKELNLRKPTKNKEDFVISSRVDAESLK